MRIKPTVSNGILPSSNHVPFRKPKHLYNTIKSMSHNPIITIQTFNNDFTVSAWANNNVHNVKDLKNHANEAGIRYGIRWLNYKKISNKSVYYYTSRKRLQE